MRKIVLLACERSHTTPAMSARAGAQFHVAGLGIGDEVWVHPKGGDRFRLPVGSTPIPTDLPSFIIEKIAGSSPASTSVEVVS